MMTGKQYRASLDDGRVTYFQGRLVESIEDEPLLRAPIDRVAATYDRYYAPGPDAVNPLLVPPTSVDELRVHAPALLEADLLMHLTSTAVLACLTAAPVLEGSYPDSAARIRAYADTARRADIRIAECVTDAKGDRALAPSRQPDPDSYVRVVSRDSEGIVIRGAKLHVSGAAFCHDLMVMPTKALKPDERDYAVACAVPVAAKGVRIVSVSYGPGDGDGRHFPVSSQRHYPEGFVIFDDVFVPHDRVFLDGQHEHAAVFAHALGLWERLGGVAQLADQADTLVGLAQLITEANGLTRVPHIREKIADMAAHAALVRAAYETAVARAETTPDGLRYPSELYTNAGKLQGATQFSLMVRHLHDIAGGSVVTAPTMSDFDHPDLRALLGKYLATGEKADGEFRLRLFHTIRDITADRCGGWWHVTNVQSGGGLHAQRLVTLKHYDMDRARRLALAEMDGARTGASAE